MENFIEKLKGVDKKVWIGIGIGVAVLLILIIALVIGLGDKQTSKPGNGTQNGTQTGTETEGGVTEVFGSEGLGTENIGTEITTEITTETELETETTESESESQTQGPGGTTVTQNPDVNGVTQTPTTTTPDGQEILGLGSKEQPYEVIPNLDTMSVTTVAVPAGQTLYYNIQRVGGKYFTINDADAYVITSNGTRYDASNGKISFQVENAMANEYVSFQIGNKSGSAKTFTIKFSDPKGTQMNPEVLSGNGPFSKHLNEGDEVGYHYKLTAAQSGTLRIYMTASVETEMNVQNTNVNATVAQSFTQAVQTDEQGRKYMDFPVSAGEEIRIHVQAIKQGRKIPAADINFEFAYY